MQTPLRLVHFSDPHFGSIILHPNQFLSKRWIGNFNLIFFRNQFYHVTPLFHLPELMDKLQVESIILTGDFTTTSLEKEFEEAAAFVQQFSQKVHCMPGNHDCYTKEAEENRLYYRYFPDEDLQKDRISLSKIKEGWWVVILDCAVATPPFNAYGHFFPYMEEKLEKVLSSIPQDDFVIVANHFPLIPSGSAKHDLKGVRKLQGILKRHPNVQLYLHGHDHQPYFIDQREFHLPLINNAGSVARKVAGGFSLLDLDAKSCHFQRFALVKGKRFEWAIEEDKKIIF